MHKEYYYPTQVYFTNLAACDTPPAPPFFVTTPPARLIYSQ